MRIIASTTWSCSSNDGPYLRFITSLAPQYNFMCLCEPASKDSPYDSCLVQCKQSMHVKCTAHAPQECLQLPLMWTCCLLKASICSEQMSKAVSHVNRTDLQSMHTVQRCSNMAIDTCTFCAHWSYSYHRFQNMVNGARHGAFIHLANSLCQLHQQTSA